MLNHKIIILCQLCPVHQSLGIIVHSVKTNDRIVVCEYSYQRGAGANIHCKMLQGKKQSSCFLLYSRIDLLMAFEVDIEKTDRMAHTPHHPAITQKIKNSKGL